MPPAADRDIPRRIRKALREAHDPERARNEKRYLKSPFKFFGIPIPVLRKLAKEIAVRLGHASRGQVHGLARELWASEYHQEKTLAIFLLARYPEYLDMKAMPMIEKMLRASTGWDHTDYMATSLVAEVLEKNAEAYAYLDKWKSAESHWVRRAALISQIPLMRKGQGDRELFFRLASGMLHEKEFFIRKAIGWTVRELSKHEPEAARDYLISIRDVASGLTMREGARRLPDIMKKEVLDRK